MQGLHYLSRMDVQLDKLTNLISELLDLSRMKWGKLTLQARPMDWTRSSTKRWKGADVELYPFPARLGSNWRVGNGRCRSFGAGFPQLVHQCHQVFSGADTVRVCLFREGELEYTIVSVQDFGIGIGKEHHERIFERFYQVTDPEEKRIRGWVSDSISPARSSRDIRVAYRRKAATGTDDFLAKPFNIDTLLAKIAHHPVMALLWINPKKSRNKSSTYI